MNDTSNLNINYDINCHIIIYVNYLPQKSNIYFVRIVVSITVSILLI